MSATRRRRPFVKLKDPARYVACPWELHVDAWAREYWVGLFERHLEGLLHEAVEAQVGRGMSREEANSRAGTVREEFVGRLRAFGERPGEFGAVTIITLDRWREECLARHGFPDPYVDVKARENGRMLPLLPGVCRRIDSLEGEARAYALVTGVFAGNIFDMGAEPVMKMFARGGGEAPSFENVRENLKPRPWVIDDYDRLAARMREGWRKVVYFCDNSGSDFLLGAVPFMRELARRGTEVVIAANERPALNDMTVQDVREWWPRIVEAEPSLAGLPIEIVSTGTGEPLIDLSEVSEELNDAAGDAELVVLEGMGRGVESNLYAEFNCDVLSIAMVKDPAVARHVGGELFDLVCRFR